MRPPPPLHQLINRTVNEAEMKIRTVVVKNLRNLAVVRDAAVEKGGRRDAVARLIISRNITEGGKIHIKPPTVVDMDLILQEEVRVTNLIVGIEEEGGVTMIRVDAVVRTAAMITTPEKKEMFTERIVIDLGEVLEEKEVHPVAPVDRAVVAPIVVTVVGLDRLVGAEVVHPVGAEVVRPMVPEGRGV